jgi:hypothetical protein
VITARMLYALFAVVPPPFFRFRLTALTLRETTS